MELSVEERLAIEQANIIEASRVFARLEELAENPIRGDFDRAHLSDIHAYAFQDFPRFWFSDPEGVAISEHLVVDYFDFEAGSLRYTVDDWNGWHKSREYPSLHDQSLTSFYSRMNDNDVMKLDTTLENINIHRLSEMPAPEFAKELANLYAQLDYIHPFQEGNSRTLREFTRELGEEAGFAVNWEVFNSPKGREQLYAARDLSLCENARFDYHGQDVYDEQIQNTLKSLNGVGFKSLSQLFSETPGFIEPLADPSLENEKTIEVARERDADFDMN